MENTYTAEFIKEYEELYNESVNYFGSGKTEYSEE
jgi:hypothetical protein